MQLFELDVFQIAGLKNDPHEIERFLKRTVYEALNELADPNNYEQLKSLSEDDATGDIQLGITDGADGEPVGGSVQEAESGGE